MWGVQFCDASELEPKLRQVTLSPTATTSPEPTEKPTLQTEPTEKPTLQKNVSQDSNKEYLLVDYPDFDNRGEFV